MQVGHVPDPRVSIVVGLCLHRLAADLGRVEEPSLYGGGHADGDGNLFGAVQRADVTDDGRGAAARPLADVYRAQGDGRRQRVGDGHVGHRSAAAVPCADGVDQRLVQPYLAEAVRLHDVQTDRAADLGGCRGSDRLLRLRCSGLGRVRQDARDVGDDFDSDRLDAVRPAGGHRSQAAGDLRVVLVAGRRGRVEPDAGRQRVDQRDVAGSRRTSVRHDQRVGENVADVTCGGRVLAELQYRFGVDRVRDEVIVVGGEDGAQRRVVLIRLHVGDVRQERTGGRVAGHEGHDATVGATFGSQRRPLPADGVRIRIIDAFIGRAFKIHASGQPVLQQHVRGLVVAVVHQRDLIGDVFSGIDRAGRRDTLNQPQVGDVLHPVGKPVRLLAVGLVERAPGVQVGAVERQGADAVIQAGGAAHPAAHHRPGLIAAVPVSDPVGARPANRAEPAPDKNVVLASGDGIDTLVVGTGVGAFGQLQPGLVRQTVLVEAKAAVEVGSCRDVKFAAVGVQAIHLVVQRGAQTFPLASVAVPAGDVVRRVATCVIEIAANVDVRAADREGVHSASVVENIGDAAVHIMPRAVPEGDPVHGCATVYRLGEISAQIDIAVTGDGDGVDRTVDAASKRPPSAAIPAGKVVDGIGAKVGVAEIAADVDIAALNGEGIDRAGDVAAQG